MGKNASWLVSRENLLEIWDFEENGDRPPESFKWEDVVSWNCEKGHSYPRKIGYQVKGISCTVCSGKTVLLGVIDLASTHPRLAAEWDTESNVFTPDEVYHGSTSRYFWRCNEGHRWDALLQNRIRKAQGCPFCGGIRPIPGKTDFATLMPQIAAEWHPLKNQGQKPDEFLPFSDSKAWFVCSRGHEWEAQIKSRSRGTGCPTCSGTRVEAGFNDLHTTHPQIAELWNFDLNAPLAPNNVSIGGGPFWFTCPKGHDFQTFPHNLKRSTKACPVCASKVVVEGENDFASLFPRLAKQWHPTKNKSGPNVVPRNGAKRWWWICDEGHEWLATTSTRINGLGCPVCGGWKTLAGFNDLASQYPHLVSEWAQDLNEGLLPSGVNKNSNDKAWWRCDSGHVWRSVISTRTRLGVGCPSCHKGGYSPGEPGYLYLLRREATEEQQFGITNVPESRLSTHRRSGWEVLDVVGPADGVWVAEVEDSLKAFFLDKGLLYRRNRMEKFDGYTESWDASKVRYQTLSELLRDLREWE